MTNIAIFASGTGSNAQEIMKHFQQHNTIRVALVVSNKSDALILEKAQTFDVPTYLIHRAGFYQSEDILNILHTYTVGYVVLAGFLWLIPDYLVREFPKRILNIHPALLPKYGGKGMYGMYVHQAVKAAGEQESGMTIHLVNEQYDEGDIIFQAKTAISPSDTAADIQKKVLRLEHKYFAKTIEALINKK